MHTLLLLISSVLADPSDYLPQQIRLSWSDLDTSMVVTWASESLTSSPAVKYTPVESPNILVEDYSYSEQGSWKNFTNHPDDSDARLMHVCSATMTGLKPNTYYTYIVGDPEYGWSSPYTFLSRKNDSKEEVRFLVVADLGTGPEITDTVNSLTLEAVTYQYDGLVHAGDMAYDLDSDDGKNGDLFFSSLEPVIARIPYFISQGNHESWEKNCQQQFKFRLNLPGDSNNLYYSINIGPAHLIFWTSEPYAQHHPDLEKKVSDFLESDFSQIERSATPWVISIEHRPFVCSPEWLEQMHMKTRNNYCINHSEEVREKYEYIFYKNSVDLHIFGHVHAYERLAPSYNNKTVPSEYDEKNLHINPNAPVMLVVGNAGQQETYTPPSTTPLPFSMSQTSEVGYGRLTVYNSTNLRFEMVNSNDRSLIDQVDIIKGRQYEAKLAPEEPEGAVVYGVIGVLILAIIL